MICPVMTKAGPGESVDCIHDRCAWWEVISEQCLMVRAAQAVVELPPFLLEIRGALGNLVRQGPR